MVDSALRETFAIFSLSQSVFLHQTSIMLYPYRSCTWLLHLHEFTLFYDNLLRAHPCQPYAVSEMKLLHVDELSCFTSTTESLVGGLEHVFSHILWMSSSQLTSPHIFRGVGEKPPDLMFDSSEVIKTWHRGMNQIQWADRALQCETWLISPASFAPVGLVFFPITGFLGEHLEPFWSLNRIVLQQYFDGNDNVKQSLGSSMIPLRVDWNRGRDLCRGRRLVHWAMIFQWVSALQDRSHWASGNHFHKGSCRTGYVKSVCCAHDDCHY